MKKVIVMIFACVLALALTGCGNSDYDTALSLYEAGNYAEAEVLFAGLGDYKDSITLRLVCRYGQAMELYEAGSYEDAENMFQKLGNYEDSATMLKACYYARALALQEAGEYEAAIELYRQAPGYEESDSKVLECRQLYVDQQMEAQEYGKALPHLKALDKAGVLDSNGNALGWCTLAAYLQENRGYTNIQTYSFTMRLTQDGDIEILAYMADDEDKTDTTVVNYSVKLGYNEAQADMTYSYSFRIETTERKKTLVEWGKEVGSTTANTADFTTEIVVWDSVQYEGENTKGKPVTEALNVMQGPLLAKIYREMGIALEATELGINLWDLGFEALAV